MILSSDLSHDIVHLDPCCGRGRCGVVYRQEVQMMFSIFRLIIWPHRYIISGGVILGGILDRDVLLLFLSISLVGLHLLGLENDEQIDDLVLVDEGLGSTCHGVHFRDLR
jgi:hypothetical protein